MGWVFSHSPKCISTLEFASLMGRIYALDDKIWFKLALWPVPEKQHQHQHVPRYF